MKTLRLALVLLALAGVTACGAEKSKPIETTGQVAALLRHTWGTTIGSPSFDYSCMRLDDRGRLFTCLAKDRTDMVRLASFDVICTVLRGLVHSLTRRRRPLGCLV
jgi:hypothetical protein